MVATQYKTTETTLSPPSRVVHTGVERICMYLSHMTSWLYLLCFSGALFLVHWLCYYPISVYCFWALLCFLKCALSVCFRWQIHMELREVLIASPPGNYCFQNTYAIIILYVGAETLSRSDSHFQMWQNWQHWFQEWSFVSSCSATAAPSENRSKMLGH